MNLTRSQYGARPVLATSDRPPSEQAGTIGTQDTPAAVDASVNNSEDDQCYRLVSIEAVRAPEGCAGRDWFVYRIAQGENAIVGYRRGNREQVGADVDTIVAGLNGRREWANRKKKSKARRR